MKLKVVVWSTNFVTGNDFCRTIKIIHLYASSTSDRHQRESFHAEIFELWFEILPIVNIIRFNSHMVGRKNPSLFDWVSQIVAAKPSCKVYENFMARSAVINFALKKGTSLCYTCIFFKDANEVSQHEFEAMIVGILGLLISVSRCPRAKKVVDNCK